MAEIIYYVHLFNCSGAYIIMCGAFIKEKDFWLHSILKNKKQSTYETLFKEIKKKCK